MSLFCTRKRLKQLNGVDDSFLGFGQIIYFDEDQMAPAPKNPLIEFRGNSVGAKMNFSKNQLVRDKDGGGRSFETARTDLWIFKLCFRMEPHLRPKCF